MLELAQTNGLPELTMTVGQVAAAVLSFAVVIGGLIAWIVKTNHALELRVVRAETFGKSNAIHHEAQAAEFKEMKAQIASMDKNLQRLIGLLDALDIVHAPNRQARREINRREIENAKGVEET